MKTHRRLITLVAVLGLAAAPAHAEVIFSENFESSGLVPATYNQTFGVFTIVTAGCHQMNPGAGNAWLNPMPPELGTTFGVLYARAIVDANLPETYTANTTYTLSFTQFRRDDVAADGFGAQLMNPSTQQVVGQAFPAVTETGAFIPRTLSVTIPADSPFVGQTIKVRLFSDQGTAANPPQGGIDNIVLTATPETDPPAIVALAPGRGTSGYPGAALVATFNEPIALTGGGSITLTDTGDGSDTVTFNLADPSRVAVSGRNLILTPPSKLAFGTPFEVAISAGTIEDLAATPNPFSGTTAGQWTFTTAAQEFTAPVITTTIPQDGVSSASIRSLVATFDQNLLLASGATTVRFQEDFESGNGGFTTSGFPNDWAWGAPDSDNNFDLMVTTGNGGSAKCWATNLGTGGVPSGNITVGANSILQGPAAAGSGIDLTGVTAPRLQFAAAVDASIDDILEVRVKEVGTGTTLVTVSATGLTPPVTAGWATYGPYDISAAAGHRVYLEFRFQGRDSAFLGLYLDDVRVTGVDPSKAITLRNLTTGIDTVIPVDDASRVAVSGNTLTISPGPLALETDYAVRIGAGAVRNFSDLGFAGISNDLDWNFTTGYIIVSDTLAGGGDGILMTGRLPETSASGAAWLKPTNMNAYFTTLTDGYGNPLPGAFGEAQGASAVSIASAGLYTKPTRLSLSADLAPRNTQGPSSAGRGVALGFHSVVGGNQYSQNRFTGLLLDDAGNLNLVQDPNPTGFFTGPGVFLGTPIAFAGNWNPHTLRRLSYDVDLTSGAISNISLEGSSATYSFSTELFSDAATQFAGVYSSGAVGGSLSAMDNFVVAAVTKTPQLVSTSPADDAVGVLRGASLVVTFNQAVRAGQAGAITLKRSSDNSTVESFNVTSTSGLTFSGKSVTINPSANLAFDVEYHVLIDPTAIENLGGFAFAGIADPTAWSFTTVVQEFTAPVITLKLPADSATRVAVSTKLVATFNQNILLASAAAGDPSKAITLRNLTTGSDTEIAVDDATQVSASGNILTITPATPLTGGSAYAVWIGASAVTNFSDLAFAGIANDTEWNFATAPTGETLQIDFSDLQGSYSGGQSPGHAAGDVGGLTWNTVKADVPSGLVLDNGTAATGVQIDVGSGNPINWSATLPEASTGATVIATPIYNTALMKDWFYTTNNLNLGARVSGLAPGTYRVHALTREPNQLARTYSVAIGTNISTLTDAGVVKTTPIIANTAVTTWTDGVNYSWADVTVTATTDWVTVIVDPINAAFGTLQGLQITRLPSTGGGTFASWIAGYDVGGQPGFAQDPDGDGLDNGVEAWFGTSPAVGNAGLTQLSKTGSVFRFQHPVAEPALSDVTGSYQWSRDLVTWHPDTTTTVGDTTVTINATSDTGTTTVTADTTGSVNPPATLFLRAVATQK